MIGGRQFSAWCGILAPVIALGAIAAATVLASPETFTWRNRALSDLGRPAANTFWLFNGGLVLGGLVGMPFGWRLWTGARNRYERLGVFVFGIALIALVCIGVFFVGHTASYGSSNYHFAAAIGFFVSAPIAQWVFGSGMVLANDRRWGVLTIWFGNVHAIAWLFWILFVSQIASEPWAWFAVPETIAALAFGGWVFLLARRLKRLDARPFHLR